MIINSTAAIVMSLPLFCILLVVCVHVHVCAMCLHMCVCAWVGLWLCVYAPVLSLSHAVHMQSNLMAMELTYLLSNAAPQYEEYSTGVLWEGVGVTRGVVWGVQHRCGCCRGCTIIVMYTICTQVCSQRI